MISHHTFSQGGALLVYYHGAIPVDYYYLVNRVLLLKEVMVRSVVDKFLFKVNRAINSKRDFDFYISGAWN